MRWALYLAGVAFVVAIAFWSFSVTYRTKDALDDIARLNRAIALEREAVQVLEAEWAWLNAPDRLARLVAREEAALNLAPMTPAVFGEMADAPLIGPDDGMAPVAIVDLEPGAAARPAANRPARSRPAENRPAANRPASNALAAVESPVRRGSPPVISIPVAPAPAAVRAVSLPPIDVGPRRGGASDR